MSKVSASMLAVAAIVISSLPAMAARTAPAHTNACKSVSHKCATKAGTLKIKSVNPLKKVK